MSRPLRWVAVAVAAVVALGAGAWTFRKTIVLHGPAMVRRWTEPIAPHREIEWQRGPKAPSAPPNERPPNVVVILADDLGYNDVSLHGGDEATVPTPHIDSIAAGGVTFANGYAGNAVCAPSRAMILTGRYSTRFGFEFTPTPKGMATVIGMFYDDLDAPRKPIIDREGVAAMPPFAELGMPPEEVTLAELLRDVGYHTIHIGKWHLGSLEKFRPNAQGFDETLFMENGKYLPDDDPEVVNSKQDFDPIDQFLWPNMRYATSFNGGEVFEPKGYLTDYYTEEAVRAIEANRNRPFFLYLAHWAPHTPLQALRADYEALGHIGDHRRRVYAAMIRALDRSVGRVLEALRAHGLEDNTLVIFTSDNGGAHYIGLRGINDPFRGWKLTLFEGGTHVPFLAQWPARLPRGVSYRAPVGHIDIYATAAAAAGVPVPDDRIIDGVDLIPYLRGERRDIPHDVLFWREGHYQVVLAKGWKLQVSNRPRKVWLFHLEEDPTELVNVADRHPEKVDELKALLAAHNAEQAAPAWPSVAELPVSIDKTLAEPQSADDEYVYWPN